MDKADNEEVPSVQSRGPCLPGRGVLVWVPPAWRSLQLEPIVLLSQTSKCLRLFVS